MLHFFDVTSLLEVSGEKRTYTEIYSVLNDMEYALYGELMIVTCSTQRQCSAHLFNSVIFINIKGRLLYCMFLLILQINDRMGVMQLCAYHQMWCNTK